MIYIVGGNITSTLNKHLESIGVKNYTHVALNVHSIDRAELLKSAEDIRSHLRYATIVITIGKVAHIVADYVHIDHFCLEVHQKNQFEVAKSLAECKNFIGRKYYEATELYRR